MFHQAVRYKSLLFRLLHPAAGESLGVPDILSTYPSETCHTESQRILRSRFPALLICSFSSIVTFLSPRQANQNPDGTAASPNMAAFWVKAGSWLKWYRHFQKFLVVLYVLSVLRCYLGLASVKRPGCPDTDLFAVHSYCMYVASVDAYG